MGAIVTTPNQIMSESKGETQRNGVNKYIPGNNSHKKGCPSKYKRCFYRRNLPEQCVSFSSLEGRRLFRECLERGTAETFFPLSEQFTTQDDPAFCGLSTLCMSLNALSIDPGRIWKGAWRWFHEEMLECCVSLEYVKKNGINLEEFARLARANGAQTPLLGGGISGILRPGSECNLDTFRSILREVCKQGPWCKRINCLDHDQSGTASFCSEETSKCQSSVNWCRKDVQATGILVANYSRKTLGQTGSGHFSPIAAFHEEEDKCLIMDVARFKYPPHWVSVELLFEAMEEKDNSTNCPRGIILLAQGEGIWKCSMCYNDCEIMVQGNPNCEHCGYREEESSLDVECIKL